MAQPDRLPGPRLPPFLQALMLLASPVKFLSVGRRRYGPIFGITMPFIGPIACLSDPAAIDELFALDGVTGHAGAAYKLIEPLIGPHSLALLDREEHRRERKMLAPAFRPTVVRATETVIREAVTRELNSWPRHGVVQTRTAMQRIAFEVLARTVLGIDDPALRAQLDRDMDPILKHSTWLLLTGDGRDWGPYSPGGWLRRARRRADATLGQVIEQRRGEAPRSDMLGLLLQAVDSDGQPFTNEHIRDELITMLIAGHDTTAHALAWFCERLARSPQVQQGIRNGGPEQAAAATCEILRLRPPIIQVGRTLSEDTELAGHRIPAGTTVMPFVNLVHSDSDNYHEPEQFDPDRFAHQRPDRHTWLPFGGGTRRCLGAGLAEFIMTIVATELLARFDLTPVSRRPERARFRGIINLVPAHGGKVQVRARTNTAPHPQSSCPVKAA